MEKTRLGRLVRINFAKRLSCTILALIILTWVAVIVFAVFFSELTLCSTNWFSRNGYLKHSAIFEVSATIGLSSVLIGWIYVALNKDEYGIPLTNLLSKICKGYHLSVVSHIVAILCTIWFTSSTANTGSDVPIYVLLLLVVVIFSLVLHMFVFVGFVHCASMRRDLAIEYWKTELYLRCAESQLGTGWPDFISFLSHHIPCDDGQVFCEMCHVRSAALQYWCKSLDNQAHMIEISYSWGDLLEKTAHSRRSQLVTMSFAALGKAYMRPTLSTCFLYCASYIIWLVRHLEILSDSQRNRYPYILIEEVSRIVSKVENTSNGTEIAECLQLLSNLLIWRYFLVADTDFLSDLMGSLKPVPFRWEFLKDFGLAFLCALPTSSCYTLLSPDQINFCAWNLSVQKKNNRED